MKKFLRLATGLVLCLLLAACGGSKGEVSESDIIVHMEVNPSFDMHVNDDGIIKGVDCLNEDAQTVYAEMDLTGVAYEDGFKQLLTAIKDGGFLQEGDAIKIIVRKAPEVTLEVEEALDEILDNFSTNVMPIEVEMSEAVVDESVAVSNKSMAELTYQYKIWMYCDEDEMPDMTIYLDEQQLITFVEGDDESSKSVIEKANVTGMPLKQGYKMLLDMGYTQGVFSSGRGLDIIIGDAKGTHDLFAQLSAWAAEYCLESGNSFNWYVLKDDIVWENYSGEHTEMNGQWVMVSTYENGILKSTVKTAKDGSKEEYHYEMEGVLSYIYKMNARDGSCQEEFYEHGRIQKITTKMSEGTVVETVYAKNGNPLEQHEVRADGTVMDITFNLQGEQIYYRMVSSDGTVTEWYAED